MHRNPRQVSLAAAIVLSLTSALTIATAGAAGATPPDLSNDDAINAYLTSIGVNPAEAVWQETHKNYAGPSCPGAGWSCVPATTPIVQITDAGGTNLFACGGLDCIVVQVALSGGQNGAGCLRGDNQSSDQTQVCDITQTNVGNQTNAATIAQNIQQRGGQSQTARQVARITQDNTLGRNVARINQVIGQRQDAKSGVTLTQSQEAHQGATVDQTTERGGNASNVNQRQDQSQTARKVSTQLTQRQNTDLLPPTNTDPSCDQPFATPYDQDKNQCADVSQVSSDLLAGGTLDSTLGQVINETQNALASPIVNQAQGESALLSGQLGTVDHLSSGLATNVADEDMSQSQAATGATSVSQIKFTGDPRCCQTQGTNLNDTSNIDQTTNQTASDPNAFQQATLSSHCVTTGNCDVAQSSTINGETETNTCTGSPCEEELVCTSAEGETSCSVFVPEG